MRQLFRNYLKKRRFIIVITIVLALIMYVTASILVSFISYLLFWFIISAFIVLFCQSLRK